MPPLWRLLAAGALLALFSRALFPGAAAVTVAADVEAEEWMVASREAFSNTRWEDALAPTRALVERFPSQQVYSDRLARIYYGLGRSADEAAAWEQFVKTSPTPEDACPAIGHAYLRAGDRQASVRAFERCKDFDPTNGELWSFLGRAYQRERRHDEALKAFQEGVRVDPLHSDSRIGLAGAWLIRNDASEALAVIEPAIERVADNPDVHLMHGLALQRLGRREAARTALERAAALSDTYVDVQVALGVLDFTDRRFPDARARFTRALELDPGRRLELQVWLERLDGVAP